MDLNGIAGNLQHQKDDASNSETMLITSEASVEGDTIEYVTVTSDFEPEDNEVETFHCDPSDPSIIYDSTGEPVNMDSLNPQEKEVIMAVQERLVTQGQEQEGDIKEEDSDDDVIKLMPVDLTTSSIPTSSKNACVVALPPSGSGDVIASAMLEVGVDHQPGDGVSQEQPLSDSKEVTYWVVPKGSSRGRDKLYDSLGYSYTVKSKNRLSVTWRCKLRTKKFFCKARVIQNGNQFVKAGDEHNHDTSGRYIETAKQEPPQMVHSVGWDVTPVPVTEKRKRKIQEIIVTKEEDNSKDLESGARVVRIAFEQEGAAASSSSPKPTVVIVETPLPPRNKRKTSTPHQVVKARIKQEAGEAKSDEGDSDELPGLQDTDELISPGIRKVGKEAEQADGNVKQEDYDDSDMESEDCKLTYRIIHGGSARRCDKLFDSLGYSYTIKRVNSESVTWRCTWRQKQKIVCGATVKQWGEVFIASAVTHNHSPRSGEELNTVLTQKMKQMSQSTPERPLPEIAREQIGEMVESGVPRTSIPKLDNLLRKVHHFKRNTMFKNPKTLDFKLDRSLIPNDFLRDDLNLVDARHLVFATDHQLKLLKQSKLWYIDCAVCVENKPFYQLLTVHVFVRKDESVKQVPALFAFMSRKTLEDCTAVLRSIKLCIQDKMKLKKVVLQFESSMWNACNTVFPEVKRSGCTFHFQQCVYDKMLELGLRDSYEEDQIVRVFVKQLMSLAMVPYEFVGVMFTPMERKAPSKELADLCSSFRKMWLETSVWTLKHIAGFDTPIRTEEDTGGWNRCLNRMGWSKSSLYMMVRQLFNKFYPECDGCQVISEKELKLHQRKRGNNIQRKIFKLWKSYQNGGKSPKGLMKSLAQYCVY